MTDVFEAEERKEVEEEEEEGREREETDAKAADEGGGTGGGSTMEEQPDDDAAMDVLEAESVNLVEFGKSIDSSRQLGSIYPLSSLSSSFSSVSLWISPLSFIHLLLCTVPFLGDGGIGGSSSS